MLCLRNRLMILLAVLAFLVLGSGIQAWSADAGFQPLFDGKTLDGWDGNPKFWRVEDGLITGETTKDNPTKGNTFLVWRKGTVADCELRFEFRFQTPAGNSGFQYRSFEDPEKWGKWVIGGYQADFDAGNSYTGILYGERFRGILALRGQKTVIGADHKPKVVEQFGDAKELQKYIKKNDWNEFHVTAKGFDFVHEINGHKMVEVVDEDKEMRKASGLVALQLHAGPPMKIQFRNILLKRLDAAAK